MHRLFKAILKILLKLKMLFPILKILLKFTVSLKI